MEKEKQNILEKVKAMTRKYFETLLIRFRNMLVLTFIYYDSSFFNKKF